MFSKPETRLVSDAYFNLIKIIDYHMELQSISTSHYWLIKKVLGREKIIVMYHKHKLELYYHYQRDFYSVGQAIDYIKNHDDYYLSNFSVF